MTQTLIFLPSRPLFLQALRYPNSIDLALTLHVFTSFTRAFPSQREGGDEKAAWRGKRSAFSFKLVPFLCSISFYTTTVPLKLYFQSSCIHLTFFCVSMSMRVGYTREEREKERESGTNNNPRATVPHIPPCSASRSHKWTPTRSSTDETYGSHLRGGGTEKRKEKQMGGGRRETAAPDLPPCAPTVGALLSYVYVCNRVETPCTLVR